MADTGLTDDLIARVEAATGANREIDHALAPFDGLVTGYCGDEGWQCDDPTCDGCNKPMGLYIKGASYPPDWRDDERLPRYTKSIDGALGLVERLLPGWRLHSLQQLRGIEGEPDWSCALRNDNLRDPDRIWAEGRSAPIAIILALLRAITARNTEKE